MYKITLLNFTYLTIFACLLGVNFFTINMGFFQLSPYRILFVFSLFILPKIIEANIQQYNLKYNFHYVFFLLIWIIYSFLPVFWVYDFGSWAKSLSFLITGLFSTLLVFGYLDNSKKLLKSIEIITIVSSIYFCLAFYEMFTGNYLFVTEGNLEYYQEFSLLQSVTGFREPVTVFGNPNDYALFLYFTFVFSFILIHFSENYLPKIYFILVFIISIFLIICTQSRSCFYGSIFFILVYYLLNFIKSSNVNKLKYFISSILLYFIVEYFFNDDFSFFRDVLTVDIVSSNQGSSDYVRKNLIYNGFVFLNNTYYFGVGLGNIEYYMSHFPKFDTGETTNIHNWWMEIFVSSGILVFVYYIFNYVNSIYSLYAKFKFSIDKKTKKLNLIILACLIGFVISSIGSSSLIDSEWFWPIFAICIKISTLQINKAY